MNAIYQPTPGFMVRWSSILFCLIVPVIPRADGNAVDKIYHPYVDALEQELEWRAIYQDDQPDQPDHRQLHRLSYGRAFGDRWFGEVYLTGDRAENDGFSLEAYEVEAKWQITEQGEYWADWGLLFELEKQARENIWEFSTGILAEKEWGRWSGTANVIVSQEWGQDIEDEIETSLGLQTRYRLSRWIEPALELYANEQTLALGPVLMGNIQTGVRRSLHWEAGFLFGLDDKSANNTLRLLIEYEF
ncbi:hypothetical protein [Porticoccus sp.]|uniref:hypothetical protein n=1 Tax=Porticoccus sp. TaxID=2024853 RepID=UPI003F6A1050